MEKWIKLSLPHLSGKEAEYAGEAIASTWIVPLGPYVDEFENRLGEYLGAEHVVALSAGTAAIHLGLIAAGVKRGDEVICQSMTFAASANPVEYIGAKPVFVDSERSTWNMDPELLREAIVDRRNKTGRLPAAIVAVDLYGMPARLREISDISDEFGIPLIEDAAEAIGSEYHGKKCGLFGKFGILSFNGNKMITTSGGGALICPDAASKEYVKFLSTQARENRPYYYHKEIGYNYRLSNVSAAIGCAQIESLQQRVDRRRALCRLYTEAFAGNRFISVHANPSLDFKSNFWLTTILISPDAPFSAGDIRRYLWEQRIESRLLWRPMHMQPVFEKSAAYVNGTSAELFNHGLCLPSSTTLSDDEILSVAMTINRLLK